MNNTQTKINKTKYTYSDRKQLKNEIECLDKNDWESIVTGILKANNENITINSNGVCIDLMTISDNSIVKIKEYIQHKNNIERTLPQTPQTPQK